MQNYSGYRTYVPSSAEGTDSTSYTFYVDHTSNLILILFACADGFCSFSNSSYQQIESCIVSQNEMVAINFSTYAIICKNLPSGNYNINIHHKPSVKVVSSTTVYH